MNKQVKKKHTIVAIACMAAVLVSGCSSGTKTGETATPGNSQAPGSEVKKEVEKVYIYASGAVGNSSTLSKTEDYELVRQQIIEEAGIEVVPIIPPKGQEVEKLNLLLSSNEPLDIFMGDTINYRNNGAIMPLNELLDQHGSHVRALWPEEWQDSWQSLTDNSGQIWGIPSVPGLAMKATFLRTDWLKQLGLEMPNTIDELEQILQTFKEKDPAGNGNTIPMVATLSGLNLGLAAGFMDVGYGPFVDADGKVKPIVMHEGYRAFVEKIADWYKKGYIYKETFALDRERLRDLVRQNRVASAVVHDTDVLAIQFELQKNVPEAEYVVPGAMKGPQGSLMTMTDTSSTGWVISKKAKNPEGAMRLLNWINEDFEHFALLFLGIKDRHWRYVDEANRVIEKLNQDYIGEFLVGDTFAYTVNYALSDPAAKPEFDYLREFSGDTTRSKKTALTDVSYKFDHELISDKLPNRADLQRMMDEEIVKFMMGARPMSEYDTFLHELNAAGLEDWITVYTEQYNAHQ